MRADIVGHDYRAMAKRVVRNLVRNAFPRGRPFTFEASLTPAADLGELAEYVG